MLLGVFQGPKTQFELDYKVNKRRVNSINTITKTKLTYSKLQDLLLLELAHDVNEIYRKRQ